METATTVPLKQRTVMIAMDGSHHSDVTFQWYRDNMKHDGDTVLIAWNVDVQSANFGTVNLMTGDPDIISKVMHEQRVHVQAIKTRFDEELKAANVPGKVLQLHEHKAGEAIIKAANEHKADLIIVGSRGLGTIRRTLLGSVSDYVLHHAHIPVIVCKFDQPRRG